MGLKRVGTVLFGVGLLLAPLAFATARPACTEVACPDAPFSVGFAGIDATTGAIAFGIRCNTCYYPWPVTLGIVLLLVGAALGIGGIGRDLVEEW